MSAKEATIWHLYEGRPVLVQLRVPYAGVTYPNMPLVQKRRVQAEDGSVREIEDIGHTPFLRGLLRVHNGGDGGVRLLVETVDPVDEKVRCEIVVHPDDVLYMTALEKNMIERPG